MGKEILCPYCFEKFDLNRVHWRCSSPRCVSPVTGQQMEPDPSYARYLQEVKGTPPTDAEMNKSHAFERPPFKRGLGNLFTKPDEGSAYCGWCGEQTHSRLCPFCHNELPWAISSLDSTILAIVGGPAAGKSHYIAVLVEQARRAFGAQFDIAFDAMNDSTRERYRREFREPLYNAHKEIDKTRQVAAPEPLIYRVHVAPTGQRDRGMTLVFFDTAGENFQSEHELSLYARYVRHAAGIVLLVDPLQMGSIRDQLEGLPIRFPQNPTEPAEIVSRLTQQFQQFGGQKATDKIDIPLAVVFTKIDVLRDNDVIDPSSAIFSAPLHQGAFSTAVGKQIHDDVQALIARHEGAELNTLLSHYFARHQYFAVSALGRNPAMDGTLGTLAPFRVEDPLLWALSEIGFVRKQ
jgi:hypothetical protein